LAGVMANTMGSVVHFLIVYDRAAGELVRKLRFDTSVEAMRARFAAEAEFRGRSEIEVVALVAESEEALRRTHARYFLDLAALGERMSRA
jgi:hypothetical protein